MRTLFGGKQTGAGSGRPRFEPIRILQVEISQPIAAIAPFGEEGEGRYRLARSLVRLHGQPLGVVPLEIPATGLSGAEYAGHIRRALGRQISDHLKQDGLPEIAELGPEGIPCSAAPACMQERERLLAASPFVSIVVATRERPRELEACLHRLLALRYPHFEIIVVDNAPRSGTSASLVAGRYGTNARVRYVVEERPGCGVARNRGAMEAAGEIVAFTDDDALVDADWLSALAGGFGLGENVACVGGLVLPAQLETRAQALFEEYGGYGRGFTRRVFDLGRNHPKHPFFPYSGLLVTGGNMAVRLSVFRRLGGFDPALSRSGEDLDLRFRAIIAGHQVVYEPAAIIHHVHRREYGQLRRQIYFSGLGFSAYLAKCLVTQPVRALRLAALAPRGLYLLFNPQSVHHRAKQQGFPMDLTLQEWRGFLGGPFAYWHGQRNRARREALNHATCDAQLTCG